VVGEFPLLEGNPCPLDKWAEPAICQNCVDVEGFEPGVEFEGLRCLMLSNDFRSGARGDRVDFFYLIRSFGSRYIRSGTAVIFSLRYKVFGKEVADELVMEVTCRRWRQRWKAAADLRGGA
jgi:hypothetical protein